MRQTLALRAAALPALASLVACASGQTSGTAFAPAPSAGLRTAGYVAPEIDRRQPVRTASLAETRPVRIAEAAPRAAAPTAPVATARLGADRGARTEPEVPPAPPRDWSAPTSATNRAPLPDLDAILVTHERPRAAALAAETAPPTRSVLPRETAQARESQASDRTATEAREDGYALHLASYRRADQTEAGWRVLTEAHPDVLSALAPARSVIDLDGQGRFHRLLAGPLSSGEATATCAALEREGGYCAVVPWSGTRL